MNMTLHKLYQQQDSPMMETIFGSVFAHGKEYTAKYQFGIFVFTWKNFNVTVRDTNQHDQVSGSSLQHQHIQQELWMTDHLSNRANRAARQLAGNKFSVTTELPPGITELTGGILFGDQEVVRVTQSECCINVLIILHHCIHSEKQMKQKRESFLSR